MRFEIVNGFIQSYAAEAGEKEAILPAGTEGIGQYAFDGAELEKIVFPEGMKKLETGAFRGCLKLTELELPASVQSISTGAFEGCAALERVRLSENMPAYGERIFAGCPALRRIEGIESGSVAEYNPRTAVLTLHRRGGEKEALLAGFFAESGLLRSGTLLECLDETDKRLWALWLPGGEQSAELKDKFLDLLYTAAPMRFATCDELFRSIKEEKNKLMYALTRLLYPVELNSEVEIMLHNLLRRKPTACASYLVEDGRIAELQAAAEAGILKGVNEKELLALAEDAGSTEEVRAILAGVEVAQDSGAMEALTPAQIKMLNSPVYARLKERKEKLRRASLERLAQNGESVAELLQKGVRAGDRNQVRYYLAAGTVDGDTLFECAKLAVASDDIYMLQDLIEAMHGITPQNAGLLLEEAAAGGKSGVVRYLCRSLPEITAYHRALGYALRQADFDMANAILSRQDQSLKTAKDVRDAYMKLAGKPDVRILERRIVDLGYADYNYYDDDFRYMFLNTGRCGLIGDEFYETHYTLVKLASMDDRIAFIRRMAEAGHFGKKELRYLCYLATDSDEIPIAAALTELDAGDFDVRECSILGNQQTVLEELGELFTSNPNRPSDEKFNFILSRLKSGEKLRMQVKYLLKTANVGRALAILKHSSLETCEDVPMTIDYFVRHNSLEAVELFCDWGKSDECFESARSLENTEIVAWILNYQNAHGGPAAIEERFEL